MSSATQTVTLASPTTRAKELALSARRLLNDLKDLEAGMIAASDCHCPRRTESPSPYISRRRSLPRRSSSTSSGHQSLLLACRVPLDHPSSGILANAARKKRVTGSFVTFCEHLLFMNYVWKQERQLQALRASIKASERAKCSNAFKSFCDRLLLTNRIWQLEKQVQELTAEGERNKRAKVAAITRAAKQMAIDVRKESMIEEFVLDLIGELQENKRVMAGLREDYEKEICQIQGDWLKEYRRLVRENERLELERQARLVEQGISNEFEQSLFDGLESSHRRLRALEQGDGDSTLVGDSDVLDHTWDGDTTEEDLLEFDEGMSTVSSATCVSFQDSENGPRKSLALGHVRPESCASLKRKPILHRTSSVPLRKLVTTPYAGFSFNPLFFGNRETLVVSPSRAENAEPMKVTLRLSPPLQTVTNRERKDSLTKVPRLTGSNPSTVREPWRL